MLDIYEHDESGEKRCVSRQVAHLHPAGKRRADARHRRVAARLRREPALARAKRVRQVHTLLSAIAGIIDVPRGCAEVAGTDLSTLRGGARDRFRADHIGLIFQVFNLVPWLNAVGNVVLPCKFSHRRRKPLNAAPSEAAQRLLIEIGLDDDRLLAAPARSLSVGQQQRVAAARVYRMTVADGLTLRL